MNTASQLNMRYFKITRVNSESPFFSMDQQREIGNTLEFIKEELGMIRLRTKYLHEVVVPKEWCTEVDKDCEWLCTNIEKLEKGAKVMVSNLEKHWRGSENWLLKSQPDVRVGDVFTVSSFILDHLFGQDYIQLKECEVGLSIPVQNFKGFENYVNVRFAKEETRAEEDKWVDDLYGKESFLNSPVCDKRIFSTGASRNTDDGKLDFEGFLSPLALEAYAKYMHENRKLEDGSLRDSDNWQLGIPIDQYMKSMWRHFFDTWKNHRGYPTKEDQVKNLCGVIFNSMGMLHEILKEQK